MNLRPEDLRPYEPSPEAQARVSRLRGDLEARRLPAALVVGAGDSGLAAVSLLRAQGAGVVVADDRPQESLPAATRAQLDGIELVPLTEDVVARHPLVVLSPGVPRARPELRPAIEGGALVGEIELASWFIHRPLAGITGTNGKSTTTALLGHLLAQRSGARVFAGGNLGPPLSRMALAAAHYDVGAVELSSYQLESIVDAHFRVAVWLNLTPDHTDRYPDLDHYAAAKRRLVERRGVNGVAVLNAKDARCAEAGLGLGGAVRWFAATPTSDLAASMGTLLIEPQVALRVDRGREERYALDNPALVGLHNKANALAAIEAARVLELEPDAVQAGLSTFSGLPHRLEALRTVKGVRWRNDSKATNVDSTVTALAALDGPLVLIAGGRDKGAPWRPLVEAARGKVRCVLAIGEAAELIVAAFTGSGIDVRACGTLEAAVEAAAGVAEAGDEVLLSPACASFDQFANFAARGDAFRALVEARGGTA